MSEQTILEKWEYNTDIITSYDGHEQRIKTRQHPRHYVSFWYTSMDCFQAQWLRGLGRIKQSDTYYVPMWQNPIYLKHDHIDGDALYIEEECMYSLYECDHIEIFTKDDVAHGNINIVRAVTEYTDDMIAVAKKIDRPLDKRNTYIFPLRKCSVQPMNGLQYVYSNGSNVTFDYEDLMEIPWRAHILDKYVNEYDKYSGMNRFNLPEKLSGREVLTAVPTWVDDSNLTLSVEKATKRLDNETGFFAYDLKNTRSYDIHNLELVLLSKKQINNIIRFFKRVQGKYKSFYAPSWVNDLEVSRDITASSNYIYTNLNSISQLYLSNGRHKKLVIFTKDYKSYIVDILTYGTEKIGKVEYGKVMLTKMVGYNISKSNILMVSYFNLVRLDSDELQLDYESNIVANTTFILKEVDDT